MSANNPERKSALYTSALVAPKAALLHFSSGRADLFRKVKRTEFAGPARICFAAAAAAPAETVTDVEVQVSVGAVSFILFLFSVPFGGIIVMNGDRVECTQDSAFSV
jgi:hypothetical protein